MKLTSEQIGLVTQVIGAGPIADDNPVMETLRQIFGDHTFYVDANGLFLFETVEDPESPRDPAQLFQVAEWADEEKTMLQPTQPQPTGVVVDLNESAAADGGQSDGPGGAA